MELAWRLTLAFAPSDEHLKMDAGPSRKRLRRSTRSCYQCRKRKVKCQLTDENVETCAECVKSGTRCTLQPPETEASGENSPAHGDRQEHESRLERIESLLIKLVEAQERTQPIANSAESEPAVPDSLWNEFLLHSTTDPSLPVTSDRGPAILELREASEAKQSLVALLPSAQDAVTIVTNTTAWLWGAETPSGSVLNASDTTQLLEIADISQGSAMDIAKSLLLFALYMQQLPARFDVQYLESQSIEKAIALIVDRVKLYIASHEDEACSLDGIECLTLISLIQLNDGELRKAWMTFRRILDVCRLEGLHNSFSLLARNSHCSDMALRRRLWQSAVCGDCYCSFLLGLEPGVGVAPFGPEDETWNDSLADDDDANVQRHIGLVVARIAQRNAIGLGQDIQAHRQIDGELNKLQDSLPSSWWRVPPLSRDRLLDSAKEPNRLICQMWFYEARIFAHMPIAFGKTRSESLNSLENCIEASRIILHQSLGLQHAKDQLSRCRSVDQTVFVAAAVLLLAKVQLRRTNTKSRHDSDRVLLEQVIDSFDIVGKICTREHVARQISEILTTMLGLAALDSTDPVFQTTNTGLETTLTHGISLDSDANLGVALDMKKTRMEDILVSSIQSAMDAGSSASRLINQYFTAERLARGASNHSQMSSKCQAGITIDDFIDPTILQ